MMKATIALTVGGIEDNVFQVRWENTPTITIFLFGVFCSGLIVYKFMKFISRFEKTETTVVDMERRMTRVETRLSSVEKRLDAIEIRLAVLETKLDALNEKVDRLSDGIKTLGEKLDRLVETMLTKKAARRSAHQIIALTKNPYFLSAEIHPHLLHRRRNRSLQPRLRRF